MAGLGTVFVELDLDRSKFERSQQEILTASQSASLSIEKNFQRLGITSDTMYDAMRNKAINAYDAIKAQSTSTGNEIIRAEQAKNAQIQTLNEQQFGKQTSMLESLKAHWIAASVAIYAAWRVAQQGFEFVEMGAHAQQAEESFRIVAKAAGQSADAILEGMKRASAGTVDDSDIMQKAVKGMVLGLSGNEMVNIMEAARVSARVTGEDVKTAYENITDAIATGMPKALKKYGLVTKEEIAIVNAALKAGVKDVNLYTIAMDNAAIQAGKMGDMHLTAAEKIQVFRARLQDVKESFGVWLIELPQTIAKAAEAFALASAAEQGQVIAFRGLQTQLSKDFISGDVDETVQVIQHAQARKKADIEALEAKTKAAKAAAEAEKKAEEELKAALKKNAEDNIKSWVAVADEEIANAERAQKYELMRLDVLIKAMEKVEDLLIAGWVAVAEEEITNAEKAQKYENERLEKLVEGVDEAQKKEIEGWVSVAEEEISLSERVARYEADNLETMVRKQEEAWKESIYNIRGIVEDGFSGINSAISTSIKGVIMGTQTMQDAFKRMGETIALGLIDSIVNRGLKTIENELTNFLFGTAGTSGGGTVATGVAGALGAAGVAGATGATSGTGGGGGILGGVTNLVGGIQKLYALVTGAAEGGVAGAIDSVLGITNLVNALTGGTAAAGTFGGLFSAAVGPGTTALMETSMAASAAAATAGTTAATTAAAETTATTTGATAGLGATAGIAAIPALIVSGLLLAFPDKSDRLRALAGEAAYKYFTDNQDRAWAIARNPLTPQPEYTAGVYPGQAGNDPYYATVAAFSLMPASALKTEFYSHFATSDWVDIMAAIANMMNPSGLWGGATGGEFEGHASGGPVWPGWSGTVGERGPEPFVSRGNGYILSHEEARDIYRGAVTTGQGGGEITIHNHLYIGDKEVAESVVRAYRAGDDDLIKYTKRAVS